VAKVRRGEVRSAQRVAAAATATAREDPRIRCRDSSFSVTREASGDRGGDERKEREGDVGRRKSEKEREREVSRYIRRANSLTRRGRVE